MRSNFNSRASICFVAYGNCFSDFQEEVNTARESKGLPKEFKRDDQYLINHPPCILRAKQTQTPQGAALIKYGEYIFEGNH